jgi:hypothetical protein
LNRALQPLEDWGDANREVLAPRLSASRP